MGAMVTSDRGKVAMMGHEGIVPGPYLCSRGVWTWGIGHTAAAGAPDPKALPRGQAADLAAEIAHAVAVFATDLRTYESDVRAAVRVPLAQHEFDALVSFHYNTGGIAVARTTQLLNAGDRAAAGRALMGWAKNPELRDRRKAERDLFLTGVYPVSRVPVWGVTPSGRVIWRPIRILTEAEALRLLALARPQLAPATAPRPVPRPSAVGAALARLLRALRPRS